MEASDGTSVMGDVESMMEDTKTVISDSCMIDEEARNFSFGYMIELLGIIS